MHTEKIMETKTQGKMQNNNTERGCWSVGRAQGKLRAYLVNMPDVSRFVHYKRSNDGLPGLPGSFPESLDPQSRTIWGDMGNPMAQSPI